jgi:succinoglycan biosynthesis protein ExoV
MFRAVRGPHTRRAFRLPEDCPLGDPGLLAPHFWPAPLLPPSPAGEVLTVCHIGTQPPRPVPGSDAVVSMRVKPGQALEVLARIARARLVLTESLHGAILAQAYGVPWAPAASQERGPASAKWADWYAYLGLEGPDRVKQGSWQRTVSEGWSWWEEMGQQGRVRDLGPLLGAFPLDAFR